MTFCEVIALTVYSLLPIARNTFTGFSAVDPAIVDTGRGMGMTRIQMLWQVELPIASPIILSGVRIALVQAVGLFAIIVDTALGLYPWNPGI